MPARPWGPKSDVAETVRSGSFGVKAMPSRADLRGSGSFDFGAIAADGNCAVWTQVESVAAMVLDRDGSLYLSQNAATLLQVDS